MAKTATFTVRLDEDLKEEAQGVLEGMGLPMSIAVEMFLRQVAERGRLPFAIGPEEDTETIDAARERRERDFWRAYILWNFRVWPNFDSPEAARRAAADFEWDGLGAGEAARRYVLGDSEGYGERMTDEQRDACLDLMGVSTLLSDAKELIYWALDMERTFVPSLAGRYGPDCDAWRYLHLQEQARLDNLEDDEDWDEPPARGVIGARYFGVDGCGGEG